MFSQASVILSGGGGRVGGRVSLVVDLMVVGPMFLLGRGGYPGVGYPGEVRYTPLEPHKWVVRILLECFLVIGGGTVISERISSVNPGGEPFCVIVLACFYCRL